MKKKKATLILFPIEKSLEFDFLSSLTEHQTFQFFQILDNIEKESMVGKTDSFNAMLQKKCKDQQKEISRLRKEIELLTKK